MRKDNYIDNVVVKLKRKYKKDELVSFMINKQKETEIENGILKSERDELEYKLNKILKADDRVKSRACQIVYIKNIKDEVKSLREKCKKLKQDNEKLFGEIIILKQKQND